MHLHRTKDVQSGLGLCKHHWVILISLYDGMAQDSPGRTVPTAEGGQASGALISVRGGL